MDMTRIGAFLAELRKENDLTQEELGESLGVSNKTVSRWETGTYLPPVEMLQRLSERYSVSINEILSGERLTEETYRERAEENIKSALSESPFTIEERLAFFKRKWRKDNVFTMVCCVVCWIVLLLVLKNQQVETYLIAAIGSLMGVAFYVVLHNRMMTYAEGRVFDKMVKERNIEYEEGVRELQRNRWRPQGGFWMTMLVLVGFIGVIVLTSVFAKDQSPEKQLLIDSLVRVVFIVLILRILVKYYNRENWKQIINSRNMGAALLAGGGMILFMSVECIVLFTKTPASIWQEMRDGPWPILLASFLCYPLINGVLTGLLSCALLLEGYFQHGKRTAKQRLLYALLCGVFFEVVSSSSGLQIGIVGIIMAAVYLHSGNILVPILLAFMQNVIGRILGSNDISLTIINMPIFWIALILAGVWAMVFLIIPEKQDKNRGKGGMLEAVDEVGS